jgi:hypothetical protein
MRFRRRNEAESYLKAMQRMRPKAQFTLVFASGLLESDQTCVYTVE